MAFRRKKETRHSPIRNMLENDVCFHYTYVATIFVYMNARTKLIAVVSVFDPLLCVKTLRKSKFLRCRRLKDSYEAFDCMQTFIKSEQNGPKII